MNILHIVQGLAICSCGFSQEMISCAAGWLEDLAWLTTNQCMFNTKYGSEIKICN